ncbi:15355_t:CDS:2, partial [Dentiscutata heterogama]
PVTFYIYGESGAGKSGLVSKLFFNEYYAKSKKQKSGSNWWDGYKRYEIVLFDEWYTSMDWNDIVKYLNDTLENVEQKGKTFVSFLAKHGIWHNKIDLCTTELIFHKGSEEEFRNMTWDIKYRKGEFTSEELKAVV